MSVEQAWAGATIARSQSASDFEEGIVPADTLSMFPDFVETLGGSAARLYESAGIDPRQLDRRHGILTLDQTAQLLRLASAELACPDFGMRLAAFQRGTKTGNLFELVMRNAPTVGEALLYCTRHVQAYSGAVGMSLDKMRGGKRALVRLEILAPAQGDQRQALELMLLRTFDIVHDLSGGLVSAREASFRHRQLGATASYRQHFGCTVLFQQDSNGFVLDAADLDVPTPDADPQLYELATYFIENRYPTLALPATTRVKALITRLLPSAEHCTIDEVAARLGMHRRTLQRRLREEGTCFESVKDDVRRELARRCLGQVDMPLARLSEMLGYAEISALSRSCNRWFSASPRQLRKDLCSSEVLAAKARA